MAETTAAMKKPRTNTTINAVVVALLLLAAPVVDTSIEAEIRWKSSSGTWLVILFSELTNMVYVRPGIRSAAVHAMYIC